MQSSSDLNPQNVVQDIASITIHRKPKPGSNRTFGLAFAILFAIIGFWPLLSGGAFRVWALCLSLAFAAVAVLTPRLLGPLNLVWFRLGILLHKTTSPVVMGLVYYLAIVPTGLVMRWRGKDLLRLNRDSSASTYWIARDPPGPSPGSMSKQF